MSVVSDRTCRRIVVACLIASLVVSGSQAVLAQSDGAMTGYDDTDAWADFPGIARGDHWTYEVSGAAEGTVHNEVKALGPFTSRFGAEWQAFRIDSVADVEVSGEAEGAELPTSTPTQVTARKWVRASDHATVELHADIERADAQASRQEIAYDPPLVDEVYAFTTGFRWLASVQRYDSEQQRPSQEGSVRFEQEATVTERVNVTTPAGTFASWRVVYGVIARPTAIRWFSEEACSTVKEVTYTGDARRETTSVLSDFSCSHARRDAPLYSATEVILLEGTPRQPGTIPQGDDVVRPGGTASVEDGSALSWVLGLVIMAAVVTMWWKLPRRDEP